ncbi:MAG: hypothetical protein A2X22_03765 [Bacteroidetes bacterium GWF2_49_14]|nr:MAG: hypothetical protein A2X22_03765 [Bacteroidetes bacterium GWF2_49_14]
MKKYNLFLSLTVGSVLLVASACTVRENGASHPEDPVLQTIDRYLDGEGENGFSGTVLVKTPAGAPLIKCYGMANEELGIPNNPDVVYNIGSITKQFTGAAILKLQMMGKLTVSDSISKYIPGLPTELGSITFHQLLTHTSGLPFDFGSNTEIITRDELLNRFRQTTIDKKPTGRSNYSHAGYNILGVLIEIITGMDYEAFIHQYLFKPAGMKRTGYRTPDWANSVVAHGYRFCNDWGKPMDSGWLDDGPSWTRRASGGMLSTATDLYAWHLALLGNDILDEKSKKQYYYPEPAVQAWGNSASGYGWLIVKSVYNTEVIAHNGWNGMFFADFLRYIKEDITIIVLSNRFRDGNDLLASELAKSVFKYPQKPDLVGRKTVCLDTLPNNRIGTLTRNFLDLLANGSDTDFRNFIKQDIASQMIKKYSNDALVDSLQSLQNKSGAVKVRQIRLYDNRIITLDVLQLKDNQEASMVLLFDENEDYRIRRISYSGPEDRKFR